MENSRIAVNRVLLGLSAAACLGVASAAERPLTWDEAVAEAARANPALASSRLAVDASRASYYSSFNGFLPSLSLSNSVSESSAGRSPSYSASASAEITLFSPRETASIRSASAAVRSAQASLRASSANLRSSLRQGFSAMLFAQTSLVTAERIVDIRRHDAELVTLRYESGRESKGNMMRARAQSLQAEYALASARRDLRTAQRDMARQLGREGFEAFVATGTFLSAPPPSRPEDFRVLLELRTDVALAEAAALSSKASLDSAKSVRWPTLGATYSRSRAGASEFPSSRYSWSAGATLSYGLFGGGPTAAYLDTKSSRLGYEKSQSDLQAARHAALSDLETAWSNYANAAEQVKVQDALLEAARQRNDEADVRYGSGLLSFDNWEVIVSDRVSTERQALSARRAAMDAETAWHRALGRALGE
ncbi:MAG: TolC family protein [Elusimicrobia bacterium]|nr:TolC family protein [Elusimicrobiota bacterium]